MSATYWVIYGIVTGFNAAIFCVSIICLKSAQRLLTRVRTEADRD